MFAKHCSSRIALSFCLFVCFPLRFSTIEHARTLSFILRCILIFCNVRRNNIVCYISYDVCTEIILVVKVWLCAAPAPSSVIESSLHKHCYTCTRIYDDNIFQNTSEQIFSHIFLFNTHKSLLPNWSIIYLSWSLGSSWPTAFAPTSFSIQPVLPVVAH